MKRPKVADSTGVELSGADLLLRTLILRRLLRREVLADDEQTVALLLPPTVAAVVANAALAVDSRVAVNLNYTLPAEILNRHCIRKAGIRHVLTSRKVMERFQLDLEAEIVYLEDLRERLTLADKLVATFQARFMPVALLERHLGLDRLKLDDVVTIIFTSGATGEPKGVMLTHGNIGSNLDAFSVVLDLRATDVLVGSLPIFHSFGYTVTVWTALTLGPKGVYHTNPLEPRQVGKISREHGGTILISTPTFLRSYVRRCEPEDFAGLEVVIAGAEQLPKEVADSFERKFGVRPVEGYGTTELSPVVSCNIPPTRETGKTNNGRKEGTVGQPIPGVSARIVERGTSKELGPGKSGMLQIAGPNVMKGYLGEPEATAQVLQDGWYTTGDIGEIDEEGFIRITGRESRFSKIGGEMVPHIRVEAAIAETLGCGGEELRVAVTAVRHPAKGERLVVFHTGLGDLAPEMVCRKLAEAGLPPLWIPSPDSFCQVDEIPVLGTGKLDLRQVRMQANERFGAPE